LTPKPLPFILAKKPKFEKPQQRLPERKRMTLVSALSGHQGVVMFADTQETVHQYSKKTIDKMEVWDFGGRPFRFAIAGACTDATYADNLQYELASALDSVPEFDLRNKIVPVITDTLTAFYGKHIWPRSGERPQMEYLIAIQPLPEGTPEIIHISETAVNVAGITTHNRSIGVGCYLADYLFNLLLGGGEPIYQLCAAAVHIAAEVRENIDGVGKLDRIVIFDCSGGYDELNPVDIQTIEPNIGSINEAIGYLFQSAIDPSDKDSEEWGQSIIDIAASIREGQREWFAEFMKRMESRSRYLQTVASRISAKKFGSY
jgi:hypothetical protein